MTRKGGSTGSTARPTTPTRGDAPAGDWRHLDRRRLAVGTTAATLVAGVLQFLPIPLLLSLVTHTLNGAAGGPDAGEIATIIPTGPVTLLTVAAAMLGFAAVLWRLATRVWTSPATALFGPPTAAFLAYALVLTLVEAASSAGAGLEYILLLPVHALDLLFLYGNGPAGWLTGVLAIAWARRITPNVLFGRAVESPNHERATRR